MFEVVSDGVERLDGLAGVGGVLELLDAPGVEGIAGCTCLSCVLEIEEKVGGRGTREVADMRNYEIYKNLRGY